MLRHLHTLESRHPRTIAPSYSLLFMQPLSSKPLDGSYLCVFPGSKEGGGIEFTNDWLNGDSAEFRSGNVRSVYVERPFAVAPHKPSFYASQDAFLHMFCFGFSLVGSSGSSIHEKLNRRKVSRAEHFFIRVRRRNL